MARNINIGFVRRFRVRTASLRISIGRLTPFKRKYRPQALQTDSPNVFRLHIDVAFVPQLAQHKPN